MDGWEVDKRVEEANPVKTTLEDLILVDVLRKVVTDESVLGWLYTLNSHSNVNYQSHET